jgi:hypothetical protein
MHPPVECVQAAEGKAHAGYDAAKDASSSSYESALQTAYDNWQVGCPDTSALLMHACHLLCSLRHSCDPVQPRAVPGHASNRLQGYKLIAWIIAGNQGQEWRDLGRSSRRLCAQLALCEPWLGQVHVGGLGSVAGAGLTSVVQSS